jgi:hypothetical protein
MVQSVARVFRKAFQKFRVEIFQGKKDGGWYLLRPRLKGFRLAGGRNPPVVSSPLF